MSEPLFTGRSVIVVGSSRGIGLEVARSLIDHDAAVVLNGRDAEALARAAEDLGAGGGAVSTVVGSAAAPAVAQQLVVAAESMRPLGSLVVCAGTSEPPGSSILTITSDEWRELIDTHLHATFEACRAAVPVIKANGGGTVVTTSSHAFTGVFGGTGYAAGKGAVNSLTYALAAELADHGVRVNAVCPGAKTRLSSGEDYEQTIGALHRRGILDDLMHAGSLDPPPPEYVASLYTYLASSTSEGVTGQVLVGAGGYLGRFETPQETMLSYRDHVDLPPWTVREIHEHLGTPAP